MRTICALISSLFLAIHKVFLRKNAFIRTQILSQSALADLIIVYLGVKKNQTLEQCNIVERNGQLVFTLDSEIFLPEEAPVRLTNAQLEELDYRKLYEAYSSKGRKSVTDKRRIDHELF